MAEAAGTVYSVDPLPSPFKVGDKVQVQHPRWGVQNAVVQSFTYVAVVRMYHYEVWLTDMNDDFEVYETDLSHVILLE